MSSLLGMLFRRGLIGATIFCTHFLAAQTVTATFTGAVSNTIGTNGTNWSALGITNGTPFLVTVTYAGSPSSTSSFGVGETNYFFATGATITATIGSGATVFSGGSDLRVQVYKNWNLGGADTRDGMQFLVGGAGGGTSFATQHGLSLNTLYAEIDDRNHSTLPNNALSAVTAQFYPLASFNLTQVALQLANGDMVQADNLTSYSITTSAIPEPSSYVGLAGLGVLGFAAYRKRRAQATKAARPRAGVV